MPFWAGVDNDVFYQIVVDGPAGLLVPDESNGFSEPTLLGAICGSGDLWSDPDTP